jgi:histidinol phosphatase-like PHP family hydrolase
MVPVDKPPSHDLHVHTWPHSPDASRMQIPVRCLAEARRRGVAVLGFANHLYPHTDKGILDALRAELTAAQSRSRGMRLLVGVECCGLDDSGRLIDGLERFGQPDFVLAGPHHLKHAWVQKPPYGDAAAFVEHQHRSLLGLARNSLVNGIAHPWVLPVHNSQRLWGFSSDDFLGAWNVDHWRELGAVAARHDTALELGMGIHMMEQVQGARFWITYCDGLQAARAAGARFYLGSDAHRPDIVGRLDWAVLTIERLEFSADDFIDPLDWTVRSRGAV